MDNVSKDEIKQRRLFPARERDLYKLVSGRKWGTDLVPVLFVDIVISDSRPFFMCMSLSLLIWNGSREYMSTSVCCFSLLENCKLKYLLIFVC